MISRGVGIKNMSKGCYQGRIAGPSHLIFIINDTVVVKIFYFFTFWIKFTTWYYYKRASANVIVSACDCSFGEVYGMAGERGGGENFPPVDAPQFLAVSSRVEATVKNRSLRFLKIHLII